MFFELGSGSIGSLCFFTESSVPNRLFIQVNQAFELGYPVSILDQFNWNSVYFGVTNKILYLCALKGGVYYDRS